MRGPLSADPQCHVLINTRRRVGAGHASEDPGLQQKSANRPLVLNFPGDRFRAITQKACRTQLPCVSSLDNS